MLGRRARRPAARATLAVNRERERSEADLRRQPAQVDRLADERFPPAQLPRREHVECGLQRRGVRLRRHLGRGRAGESFAHVMVFGDDLRDRVALCLVHREAVGKIGVVESARPADLPGDLFQPGALLLR